MFLRPFPDAPEQKTCSACRVVFTCGPAPGHERCWCDELPHVRLVGSPRQDCLCPKCLDAAISNLQTRHSDTVELQASVNTAESLPPTLVEGDDFYWEGAVMVFTAGYLRRRGYCCESGCRHCPYPRAEASEKES